MAITITNNTLFNSLFNTILKSFTFFILQRYTKKTRKTSFLTNLNFWSFSFSEKSRFSKGQLP